MNIYNNVIIHAQIKNALTNHDNNIENEKKEKPLKMVFYLMI